MIAPRSSRRALDSQSIADGRPLGGSPGHGVALAANILAVEDYTNLSAIRRPHRSNEGAVGPESIWAVPVARNGPAGRDEAIPAGAESGPTGPARPRRGTLAVPRPVCSGGETQPRAGRRGRSTPSPGPDLPAD